MITNIEFTVLDACVAMCARKNTFEVTTGDIAQYIDEQEKLRLANRSKPKKVVNIIGIFALALLSQGQIDTRAQKADVNAINDVIDSLEEKGLIAITDISPHFCFHHDVVTFSLTDAGFKYLDAIYSKPSVDTNNPFATQAQM